MSNRYMRLTAIIFCLVFLACTGREQFCERYFADIELDGRYSIIGRFPFDPAVTPRTYCYKIAYDEEDRPVRVQFLQAGKLGYGVIPYASVQTKISYHDGFELRESLNSAGKPVPFPRNNSGDPSCIFSIRLDFDEDGNRISLLNRNVNGKPYRDSAEVVKYLWTLDENGRIIKSIGINTDEDSVTKANWERERHYRYDEFGNLIEKENIARSGKLCQSDAYNHAMVKMEYDANGNVVEKIYYDLFGNPSVSDFSDSPMSRRKYNDWGQVIEGQSFTYDVENDSIFAESGSVHYKYDERGNVVEKSFYDADGKIIIDSTTSIIRYAYDDKGNCVEQVRCLDDGTPANLTILGYPIQPINMAVYNDAGLLIETRSYNGEGALSAGGYPFAIELTSYTAFDGGWRVIKSYLDPSGRPAPIMTGLSAVKSQTEIDKYGRMTLYAFYDSLGDYEYPALHMTYDKLGNKIEEKECDEEGRLKDVDPGALSKYGYALSKYGYNEYGYALYTLVYDSLGNKIDSLNEYDPKRPDNNCRDEERLRIYNEARAKADSIRQSRVYRRN